jgi:asparaginyl-tRNA synthetase
VVTDYPKEIKAFYMRLNDDGRTVAAMDVLAPGIGEIVGGSQREERLDVLDARIAEVGLDPAAYWWYRDLRRYGTVPHAGFGLGVDRAVASHGMANIRDAIPFPRTPGSATPSDSHRPRRAGAISCPRMHRRPPPLGWGDDSAPVRLVR